MAISVNQSLPAASLEHQEMLAARGQLLKGSWWHLWGLESSESNRIPRRRAGVTRLALPCPMAHLMLRLRGCRRSLKQTFAEWV